MTLSRFVVRNAFRNKRRSVLTVLSISFSLLLLTLLMSLWRTFYIDIGAPEAALRLVTRHRVSLTFFLPGFYRQKIRAIPGVLHVAPMNWFGGKYLDDRPEHFFGQFGTDPTEIFQVYPDIHVPPDQLAAWQRDRAGAAVERRLAGREGWKLGDRIVLQGTIFPVNLELTVRAMYDGTQQNLLFNWVYVEEAVRFAKSQDDTFAVLVDSPEAAPRVAQAIDSMFRNSPQPTKTESERAFALSFVSMLGNVKAFILSIALAVVFAILLVSGNTMAMSVRERTREVALLKTLGFTRPAILLMFVAEAVALSVVGGVIGSLAAGLLLKGAAASPAGVFLLNLKLKGSTFVVALLVAGLVGFLSAFLPSYHASRLNIVEGLRHIG